MFQRILKMILRRVGGGRNKVIFTGRLCDHYDLIIILNTDDIPDEKVGCTEMLLPTPGILVSAISVNTML